MEEEDIWLSGLWWDVIVVVREGSRSGELVLRV